MCLPTVYRTLKCSIRFSSVFARLPVSWERTERKIFCEHAWATVQLASRTWISASPESTRCPFIILSQASWKQTDKTITRQVVDGFRKILRQFEIEPKACQVRLYLSMCPRTIKIPEHIDYHLCFRRCYCCHPPSTSGTLWVPGMGIPHRILYRIPNSSIFTTESSSYPECPATVDPISTSLCDTLYRTPPSSSRSPLPLLRHTYPLIITLWSHSFLAPLTSHHSWWRVLWCFQWRSWGSRSFLVNRLLGCRLAPIIHRGTAKSKPVQVLLKLS